MALSLQGISASPYDHATLWALNCLTGEFYAREAASFSATRQAPWRGWGQALGAIAEADPAFGAHPLTVLDLGCGNLRFERFLAEGNLPVSRAIALDNCPSLARNRELPFALEFREADLVSTLIDKGTLAPWVPRDACDLAAAFGFMHHVPDPALRVAAVHDLVGALRPRGFAVLSFWQFMNDPRIAAKAVATTAEGRAAHRLPPFAPNDYLLGWQHAEGVYRFCHHAPDSEIDELLAAANGAANHAAGHPAADHTPTPPSPAFREVARFSADGKDGDLNRYVVLQRTKRGTFPI